MKVILFCGGRGTRIRAAGDSVPKPLLSVGGLPILLRLMARYSASNINNFILATGHLGNIIEDYLFWTDNNTEPKKINITRSKIGSPDFITHTEIYVKNLSANVSSK